MMRKLVVPLLLFVSACTFNPEGEYFKEITQSSAIETISLSDYNDEDTIRIYKATQFQFEVSSSIGNLSDIRVLLNDTPEPVSFAAPNRGTVKFENNPYGYSNLKSGTYELKITFRHTSGSGSLADIKGAEIVDVWKKWTLIIDVDAPPAPVLKFSEENGYLKLSWDQFSKPSFKSYTIDVYMENWYKERITITDPTEANWIDSAYVTGLRMKYYISIMTVNTSSYSNAEFSSPQNVSIQYNASDSSASITWNKPKFYAGFKSYELWPSFDDAPTIITDINDTTRSVKFKKVVFGRHLGASLTVTSKDDKYWAYRKDLHIDNPCGSKKLYYFQNISFDAVKDKIAVDRYNRICYYNTSLTAIDSLPVTTSPASVTGNYLYYNAQPSIQAYNVITKEQRTLDVSGKNNYRTGPWNIQGAANGIVSYGYVVGSGPFAYVENVYNFESNVLLYEKTNAHQNSNIDFSNPVLSLDGRYAYSYKEKKLFRVNTNSLDLTGTLPPNGYLVRFRDDNTDEFLFQPSTESSIEIRSSTDISLKRTIPSPGTADVTYQAYDPGSKYIMFGSSQRDDIYFVHIDTGNVKHIHATTNTSDFRFRFVGGYLFDNENNYIKIF